MLTKINGGTFANYKYFNLPIELNWLAAIDTLNKNAFYFRIQQSFRTIP